MSIPAPMDLNLLLDRALQTGGETVRFDFKAELDFTNNLEHKIKLLRAIGAFGNTDKGGYIIIGVTNDRKVVGISADLAATYDQTPVQRLAGEYFAPATAVQVRHHEREGKKLVIIDVGGFREVPSIVRKFAEHGKERIREGTFLVRTEGAESAALSTEVELRKLCDTIISRRRAVGEQVAARDRLTHIKWEVDQMYCHAKDLNANIGQASIYTYLPIMFRPSAIESQIPSIVADIRHDINLTRELPLLIRWASAADREAEKLLDQRSDARSLRPLVQSVISSSKVVSEALGRLVG